MAWNARVARDRRERVRLEQEAARRVERLSDPTRTRGAFEAFVPPADMKGGRARLKRLVADFADAVMDGGVTETERLGGISRGATEQELLEMFDVPDHRGAATNVQMLGDVWPEGEYLGYSTERVTFVLGKDKRLERVYVGLDVGNLK
jgi:hypothetical protein